MFQFSISLSPVKTGLSEGLKVEGNLTNGLFTFEFQGRPFSRTVEFIRHPSERPLPLSDHVTIFIPLKDHNKLRINTTEPPLHPMKNKLLQSQHYFRYCFSI